MMTNAISDVLFQPLELPCGSVLKNRIAKAAMSDSLGDGRGSPTLAQNRLYEEWANGGLGLSIIGEVQCTSLYPEKPGNLVLNQQSDPERFRSLAKAGAQNNAQLWLQLGHAGAMSFQPVSSPKGPSPISVDGLRCGELSLDEIRNLPNTYAETAALAKALGFGGVQVHAAHGFLLSQFLSPLFNRRNDDYGGSIQNRMRILVEVLEAVRAAVGPSFPVGVKLNATDSLEGGLREPEALKVVAGLDALAVDLIDISGGTYFPGAKSASDSNKEGAYFSEFARHARRCTQIPLMLTGGIKTLEQAVNVIESGAADIVGIARAMVLYPDLANRWRDCADKKMIFPRFESVIEGGITAWYTMKLTEIVERSERDESATLEVALESYLTRDAQRSILWNAYFEDDKPRAN